MCGTYRFKGYFIYVLKDLSNLMFNQYKWPRGTYQFIFSKCETVEQRRYTQNSQLSTRKERKYGSRQSGMVFFSTKWIFWSCRDRQSSPCPSMQSRTFSRQTQRPCQNPGVRQPSRHHVWHPWRPGSRGLPSECPTRFWSARWWTRLPTTPPHLGW